ncbi:uncharacterized protein ACA1_045660 [Acanthamoeba castellanii str. Neff]|uniref:Uncharacterized protein n=1 Tax=Acanthamoeba castellanii (strain ATCC 30010 / Neff) TaxID=1257118 RepID=L8H184_ACACF|nr:uncharacterized protein ACA1_045660 [Acanthamoeba castellanii str. Neff]ELR18523.1 hypothetical protein ACA1_045660 [Acanthamoeba castellanii str. Neff]
MSLARPFLLALVFVALAVAVAAADQQLANDQVVVRVQGQSGKITFWIPERSDKKYTLTFDSLCEGNDCVNTFASQQFAFSTPATVRFHNISAKLVSFDSTLATKKQSGVKLTADLYVFLETGNYTVGDQTFYAVENAFKWSVNISGWVFANAANKLELGMGLLHPSYKASWDAANYTLSYPGEDAVIQFAKTATHDGKTEEAVAVTTKVKGSNVDIVMAFSSAESSIWYDPQVTVATGAASSASSFLFSLGAHLLSLLS